MRKPINIVSAVITPPFRSTASRSTTSKYSSNLDRSWSPSASPNSLDHGLQVHLQTRSITTSKCISQLHDFSLQMHLQTRSITASMCISELNMIPASKCISELLDLDLQMHLQTRSIMASKCISEFNSIAASKCISKLT